MIPHVQQPNNAAATATVGHFRRRMQVTKEGIARMQKALPQCKIEWDGGVIEPAAGPQGPQG